MKMGWKPGQGVGPRLTKAEKKKMREEYGKVKTKVYGCSLPQDMTKMKQTDNEDNNSSTDDENYENITFAPEDFQSVICKPKDNFFGLGYSGLDRRPILSGHINLFEPTPLKMEEKKKKVSIAGQVCSNLIYHMSYIIFNDKSMLERRKESDTYLSTDSRHRWSLQIMMKVDKVCSFQPQCRLNAGSKLHTLSTLMRSAYSGNVFCQQPGRCCSLSSFIT